MQGQDMHINEQSTDLDFVGESVQSKLNQNTSSEKKKKKNKDTSNFLIDSTQSKFNPDEMENPQDKN